MSNGDSWDEQIPGTDGGTSALPFGKRRRLSDLLFRTGEEPETDDLMYRTGESARAVPLSESMDREGQGDRLAHRVNDDPLQNRSGGPGAIQGSIAAGQVTGGEERGGYKDPGAGRLADLMAQRKAMDVPPPKLGFKQQLIKAIPDLLGAGITGAAYASGGLGATEGAEQGYEAGVDRRRKVQDLASQRREAEKVRLSQEIDTEARAGEQRTFQHGEDVLRQQTAEHGMDERARMAQQMETGRNQRLAETIGSREGMQQDKFGHEQEMEDQKQAGRRELKQMTLDAQMAIQRYKTAHPNQNLPPALTKVFGKYQDSQSRMDLMDKSYRAAIRDPGNQQAMMLLLTNHIGMTMGAQSGARITQAILEEAKRSGYVDERIEAHFGPDGIMTGVVLTPRQMQQMMPLAEDKLREDARSVTETEAYLGRLGNAPITPRIPGQGQGAAAGGAGGAGATAATPNAVPKPAHKPGEKVSYKGKEYTIKSINPDGSYVLQ